MKRRRRRLSRSAEFERVYRHGRSVSSRHLVLYAFPRSRSTEAPGSEEDQATGDLDGGPRLGVSVGRRVGAAVSRNVVKRTLREAFWELGEGLPADHDYVVVARAGTAALAEREGSAGVRRELRGLLEELVQPESAGGDGEDA